MPTAAFAALVVLGTGGGLWLVFTSWQKQMIDRSQFVAEMVGNPAGLGYAVVREQQAMRPELVFAYVVAIGALGVILNAALTGAVARLFPAASGRLREAG